MAEKLNGREVNPRRETIKSIWYNLGSLFRGEVTLVAVDTDLLETRRVVDVGTGNLESLEDVVDMALRQAPLTIGEAHAFEDYHGIPRGTLWDRGGHSAEFDVAQSTPELTQ